MIQCAFVKILNHNILHNKCCAINSLYTAETLSRDGFSVCYNKTSTEGDLNSRENAFNRIFFWYPERKGVKVNVEHKRGNGKGKKKKNYLTVNIFLSLCNLVRAS
jgi:hypothetical protein